jgi:hypothetical protein
VSFGSLYHTGPYLFYECMNKLIPNCYLEAPFEIQDYKKSVIKSLKGDNILFHTYFKDYYLNYQSIHNRPMWCEEWGNNEIYYSKKYHGVGKGSEDWSIYIYPNQISELEGDDLEFNYNDGMWFNNRKDCLKCKVIEECSDKTIILFIYGIVDK